MVRVSGASRAIFGAGSELSSVFAMTKKRAARPEWISGLGANAGWDDARQARCSKRDGQQGAEVTGFEGGAKGLEDTRGHRTHRGS